jgi:hypothetical protein
MFIEEEKKLGFPEEFSYEQIPRTDPKGLSLLREL